MFFSMFARIKVGATGGCVPIRMSMLSSILPMVAEIPQVRNSGLSARNFVRNSSHCTARLLPISSCHSSITTACRLRNSFSYPLFESITWILSGVVIKICGNFVFCACLTFCVLSPVRVPTSQSEPSSATALFALCSISFAKARMGVIQIS